MSERGERYQEGRPKENFPETFPARALMLEMDKEEAFHIDSKPGGKYDPASRKYHELWANASAADIEEYANVKAEATGGDFAALKQSAERKRDEAMKALGMEVKSAYDKTMEELSDDKRVFDDLDRHMGTGDLQ